MNIQYGFRSFTPLKENYFKGARPNEVRDFKSYLK